MSQILYINILVDWSLSGIMTSKRVIRESESPRPAASSILNSRMARSSVIIPYLATFFSEWSRFISYRIDSTDKCLFQCISILHYMIIMAGRVMMKNLLCSLSSTFFLLFVQDRRNGLEIGKGGGHFYITIFLLSHFHFTMIQLCTLVYL